MFIKICNTKTKLHLIKDTSELGKFKKFATKLIDVDTDKYLYIINESVHSLEHHGPNANGDAFPLKEMTDHYHTFINSRVSVDHRDEEIVGEVFDSTFVQPKISGKNNFTGGGFIENILGVNKEKAEEIRPGLVGWILDGVITDTSMGAIVAYTECSIPTCKNIAYNENQYCEHILGGKNREIKLASGEKCNVYEVCHGVTWFEDSIIVPADKGGKAGGEGADPEAKILNIVTESVEKEYNKKLAALVDTVQRHGSKEDWKMLETLIDVLSRWEG